jgi:hypothetical protein
MGILPSDIGSPDCAARMAHAVGKPGDVIGDTELAALISEKAAAVAASTPAAERDRREDLLSAGGSRSATRIASALRSGRARATSTMRSWKAPTCWKAAQCL